jgi:NAD(P)-dependent dehydrogenase (short-subunit alcohol dehydrogenase family)
MGTLDDRVVVITGAGRGLGREHALLMAAEGAKVVINDLGGGAGGGGSDASPADEVVAEIGAAGGFAVANYDDVSDAAGAERLIRTAIDTFGDLHVLVNNAGVLRDRLLVNMTEDEWDIVMRVHLRGHFLPSKFAANHWRAQSKAGHTVQASLINTTSTSGLLSNVGQANYGAAKTGIATFTEICQKELERYGVRCNAIAPAARTRLTEALIPAVEGEFDPYDPANVSPFVAYLATAECPIAGKIFYVAGGRVHLFRPYTAVDKIELDRRWTVAELSSAAAKWGDVVFDQTIGE